MKRLLLGLATLLGLALAVDGQQLYSQNCAGCHGAGAQGVSGAFPALAGNPRVQDQAYVLKVIKQGLSGPLEVGGEKFNGTMPPMPQLSDADANAVAAYLKGLGGTQDTAAQPRPASPLPAGDPARGKALFLGQQRFANGGAPCMACHTAGNLGSMGGGSLGKDKTDLYTRLGDAGIQAVLSNPAFPVMREAFKGKPLTPEEISALSAFFADISKAPPSTNQTNLARLLFAGLGGALVLFVVMFMFWNNRRVGLAERIRSRRNA